MKTLLASLAFATATVATSASAVPVSPGLPATMLVADEFYQGVTELAPNSIVAFLFTVMPGSKIDVSDIAISGTGLNSGNDLSEVEFGINIPDTGYTQIFPGDPTSSAVGSLPGFTAMSPFSITFRDGTEKPTTVGFSFETTAVPVPLPAAGGLLAMALVGAGVIASRRKKAA